MGPRSAYRCDCRASQKTVCQRDADDGRQLRPQQENGQDAGICPVRLRNSKEDVKFRKHQEIIGSVIPQKQYVTLNGREGYGAI